MRDAVIAVVGATGGLGRAIAGELAVCGARVVVAGRNAEELGRVVTGAPVAVCDLRDCDAGDAIVAVATEAYGRLDGVVNAAGIVAFGTLAETEDVIIEELFLTDVLGALWLARHVTAALAETRGFLVQVSAVVAEAPMANMVAYSAAKAALSAADRALARELRRVGVRVLDARPPHTETGLVSRPVAGVAPALKPGLEPSHVARVIVDGIEAGVTELASDAF